MRILCLHGVGNGDRNIGWREEWRREVERGIRQWGNPRPLEFHFSLYDDLFEAAPLDAATVIEALGRLIASGLFHGFMDLFRGPRGLADRIEDVRWTAGMVAQWVALEDLRAATRKRIGTDIASFRPDVILAHSLGSLILYDTLRLDEVANGTLGAGRTIVTFGSQIGNRAVRQVFGGRIQELAQVQKWWHLYNEHDDVFTCPIEPATRERFQQVDTHFDIDGWADHEGDEYLGHEQAALTVWHALASARGLGKATKTIAAKRIARPAPAKDADGSRFRALLVGIADYPDPENVLAGPVNDVFLMSAMLQQVGFPADAIRVCLDERATCKGIRERLHWLLDGAKPGETMFFFFAGHGAQVPAYGADAEVDRVDECLVPYDFDWENGDAISDNEFAMLYSQLPYEASFLAVLDCCHSGGMRRGRVGGVRGLTPPDDIRHRSIRWDAESQMWLPRRKLQASERPRQVAAKDPRKALWVGECGTKRRIGRGSPLWMASDAAYREARKAYGHSGPYTPVVFEACAEDEFAYEYRHGNTSFGVFTYALCTELGRATWPKRSRLTYRRLLETVRARVPQVASGPQTPQMLCPEVRWNQAIPGLEAPRSRR